MATDGTGKAEPGETPVAQSKQRVNMFNLEMVALRIAVTFGVDFVRTVRASFIDGIDLSEPATA